jgi:hypothetical protein
MCVRSIAHEAGGRNGVEVIGYDGMSELCALLKTGDD